MEAWEAETVQMLRQRAEQSFRLAQGTTDQRTHDALADYAQDLLKRAERMEAVLGPGGHSGN